MICRLIIEISKKLVLKLFHHNKMEAPNEKEKLILAKNIELKDIHKGKRCFIVGTGKSINEQDISLLKGEICIFMSQFHYHNQYKDIDPVYHNLTGIGAHPAITSGLGYYRELEERIPESTIIFVDILDYDFIKKNNLLRNHTIYYSAYKKSYDSLMKDGIDATNYIYSGMANAIRALQMAIYMGFFEIYLIGINMDYKFTGWPYFYPPEQCFFTKDPNKQVEANFTNAEAMEIHLNGNLTLIQEYKKLRKYALLKGTKIYNATKGGLLDVYPRVEFESLFERN